MSRLNRHALVSGRVAGDMHGTQDRISLGILLEELRDDGKAVDERGLAARAVGVGEEVQGLQTCGCCEVRIVVVGFEGFACVGCVFGGEIGCEVVETAVVRVSDRSDACEEAL